MKMRMALLLVAAVIACRPDDQKTATIDVKEAKAARAALSPQLKMHLDSGNAFFRKKDYAGARRHYVAATRADADQPAGWFGIYMVELAQGNAQAAERALQKAQSLVPGATLIHPKQ